RLDLPTLDRPANATSGRSASGRNSNDGTPRTKTHGRANRAAPAAIHSGLAASASFATAAAPRRGGSIIASYGWPATLWLCAPWLRPYGLRHDPGPPLERLGSARCLPWSDRKSVV